MTAQPLHSPFRWAENRRPSVFATDPAFRPKNVSQPAGKSQDYHIGAYGRAKEGEK